MHALFLLYIAPPHPNWMSLTGVLQFKVHVHAAHTKTRSKALLSPAQSYHKGDRMDMDRHNRSLAAFSLARSKEGANVLASAAVMDNL